MIGTAYKFIKFDKTKSTGILVGIIISIYLIGLELGMFFYLTGLIGGIVGNSRRDLSQVIVVNRMTVNANILPPFDSRWVNQLRSVNGVSDTHAMVMGNVSVRFDNGETSPAIIIGSDYPAMAAGPEKDKIMSGSLTDFAYDLTVSADFYDNRTFNYEVKVGSNFEISGKRVRVGAMTKNAKGFSSPLLYTTTESARRLSFLASDQVNAVLLTLKDGVSADKVIEDISRLTPYLKAWKTEDFRMSTIVYVMTANNMGMSFGTLVIFAIISGFFIIGLTMYSATYDRIKDYGTLKAIGADSGYITRLVMAQSFLYAISGYIISLILLYVTKWGMAKAGLLIKLSPIFLLFLFAVTLMIAVGSSLFSVQKLKTVEPSSVFR